MMFVLFQMEIPATSAKRDSLGAESQKPRNGFLVSKVDTVAGAPLTQRNLVNSIFGKSDSYKANSFSSMMTQVPVDTSGLPEYRHPDSLHHGNLVPAAILLLKKGGSALEPKGAISKK